MLRSKGWGSNFYIVPIQTDYFVPKAILLSLLSELDNTPEMLQEEKEPANLAWKGQLDVVSQRDKILA